MRRGGKHQQNRRKPYDTPTSKSKQKVAKGNRTSGGYAPAGIVCFTCGKPGHKNNACTQYIKRCFRCGKVGHEIADCATHCFIVAKCVKKLCLVLSSMNGEMIVDIPAKGSVTISLVCSNCPLSVLERDFVVDLVSLPLSGLDVILGMNWLEYNYVRINCYNKFVRFSTPGKEEKTGLLSARQLRELCKRKHMSFR
ncbi:uncharacterized protein LOC131596363 [Vicia villosa]|uniref:uncharacterized protein LOC131596363 n=1 Tax=Vicia villosa TaxID=3911 RepID=UPI00273C650A|nr:uncharacterized protein LOC131596363 [Vicia villosa]